MSNAPALAKRWAVLLVFATLLGESTWTQLTPPQQCLARPEARSPPPPLPLLCRKRELREHATTGVSLLPPPHSEGEVFSHGLHVSCPTCLVPEGSVSVQGLIKCVLRW